MLFPPILVNTWTWIVNGSVVLGSNKKCHNLSINRSSKSIIHYLIVATAAPLPWQLARSGEEEGAVMEWLLEAAGGWWSGIDWDLVLMEYLLCSIRCCSSGHHTNKYLNRILYLSAGKSSLWESIHSILCHWFKVSQANVFVYFGHNC